MDRDVRDIDVQSEVMRRQKSSSNNKKELTNDVVADNMQLINNIAANILKSGSVPPGMTFDDLVSYGIDGMLKAWDNFDSGKGIQFSVYASYRVRGEMLDSIRKEWRYRNPGKYQSPASEKVGNASRDIMDEDKKKSEDEKVRNVVTGSAIAYLLSFEEKNIDAPDNGDMSDQVIDDIHFSDVRAMLWHEVQNLNEDERKFIKMFYIDNFSQQEISEELGFSKSKVSRMHAAILAKLKERLRKFVR